MTRNSLIQVHHESVKSVDANNEHFQGDLRFLTEQMKVMLPPLDIASPEEFRLYNVFMKTPPHGTNSDWVELATIFKSRYD